MSYTGHYIDRSPNIRAAGLVKPMEMTASCSLREAPDPNDLAEKMLMRKCCEKLAAIVPSKRELCLQFDNDVFGRGKEEYKFSEFRKNFLEQMMFKRAELGRAYNFKTKPEHINNETTTFGRKTYKPPYTIEDLLKPADTMLVPKECIPSQRINRQYAPPFNADSVFGMKYTSDKRGYRVKNAMATHICPKVLTGTQTEFFLRTKTLLGRRNLKHTYYFDVEDTPLPPLKKDECNVKALLENATDCTVMQKKLVQAFAYLRKLRTDLAKNRFIHLYDYLMLLQHYDHKHTGKMVLPLIILLGKLKGIQLDPDYFDMLLKNLGLLKPNDKKQIVEYRKLIDLIDINVPFVEPQQHEQMPKQSEHEASLQTTYRALVADRTKPVNLVTQLGPCIIPKPEKIDLGDVMRSAAHIRYGLTTTDLTKQRGKAQLRRIFKPVIGEKFEHIWTEANKKYNDGAPKGLLSVDQIKTLLNHDYDYDA